MLRKGDQGPAVQSVQEALIRAGEQPAHGADGSFGEGAERALQSFQRKNGLSADGVYGPATRRSLQAQLGSVLAVADGHISIRGVHRGMKREDAIRLLGEPRTVERDGGDTYAGKDGQIALYYLPGSKDQLFFKTEAGKFGACVIEDEDHFKFSVDKGDLKRVQVAQ